jgi:alkylation response protein AidB-like acyl-CoA dehydrogenase
MTLQLLPADTANEGAEVVGSMLHRLKGTWPSRDFFARDHHRIWDELCAGGWMSVGIPGPRGGAGFSLLDLTQLAETWGRHLVPLPFIPTMLLWRWSGKDAGHINGARLTYALNSVSPFLGTVGTHLVSDAATLARNTEVHPTKHSNEGRGEAWSASLPIAHTALATIDLPDQAAMEIATLGAAELTGCAGAALEQALQYAGGRTQFGQPIGNYQAVQHRLADMCRDVEIARTAVVWAANEPARFESAARIAWTGIRSVIEGCIQIHGGFGFTWEAGIHHYARHVWAWGDLFQACGVQLA